MLFYEALKFVAKILYLSKRKTTKNHFLDEKE